MKNKYTIIGVIGIILLISLGLFIWSYNSLPQEEKDKIDIDEYNFEQLEKVKNVLNGLDMDKINFWGLDKFNKKFNQEIKPIKNCYFISSANGDEPYIFGFKLESELYMDKYGTEYYSYPKYNLPIIRQCSGMLKGECVNDSLYMEFKKIISNPCK